MQKLTRVFIAIGIIIFLVYSPAFQQEKEMPHENISFDCALCHSTANWTVNQKNISFDHSKTGFPLWGGHKDVQCRNCHESLKFFHVGTSCVDCHADIHQGELGLRCDNCHTPLSWENRRELLEEHQRTNFPLVGVHAIVDCEACHYSPEKKDIARLPLECDGCHMDIYLASKNPDHRAAAFAPQCEECHPIQSSSWQKAIYQHSLNFKLEGAHKRIECIDCHSQVYEGTPSECYACHSQDYQQATNPSHIIFGFLTTCELCHNTTRWGDAIFDHIEASGFALTGVHQTLTCNSCHINNQTSGLPRECYGCHEKDYTAVSDPNHVMNNFDRDCLFCHNNLTWSPATFNHANTAFPLTGAHLSIQCIDCHENGYVNTPTDCFSCHQNDFNTTLDPNHVQNSFSHDCTICHSTVAWSPATFDHSNTNFPLTGAHASLNCIDCHSQGYTNTPTDCYSCHQDDYQNTQNPNHAAAGFPVECESCHNTTNWNQTNWNHDTQYFPIYSGRHQGEWNLCTDCHIDPNNYLTFECILCHEHNDPVDLAGKHQGVQGYQYNSQACYNCHPTGEK